MKYLTVRTKQLQDGTTSKALSTEHETEALANSQYWNMCANDIGQANLNMFTDFVISMLGHIGNIRYYTRVDVADELERFYYIKLETYKDNEADLTEIREYTDRDSAEMLYCKDNASAETDDTILTAAHLIINHHGGVELFKVYDNTPTPEPEPEPELEI